MSLINNAVSSIQIGIEDYQSNDARRQLTAIRNIHAGILLLCKVKLQELSPPDSDEVLLKQKIVPSQKDDGTIQWVGKGKKTVDQQQIEERFKQLSMTINFHKLNKINDIRNNIEHYYFSGTKEQVREAFAEACMVIRELIMDVLKKKPTDIIGVDYWDKLYNIREVFDHELKACRESIKDIEWLEGAKEVPNNIQCPHCESTLIGQIMAANQDQAEAKFRCTACAEVSSPELLITHVLEQIYPHDPTDEWDSPVGDCPECGERSFVNELGRCAICDFSVPDDAACAVCGDRLSAEEYSENGCLCSYHAYVAERERDR